MVNIKTPRIDVMAPLVRHLEEKLELDPGQSDGDGTSPWDCLERPGTEDDAVQAPQAYGH